LGIPTLARIVAVAVAYFGLAKLGIGLDVAEGVVTPVWAPTGLALASVVLVGYRVWPGIALGAFAANVTSDVAILTAGAIAVGNTLEAVAGAWLLRRAGGRSTLRRVRDVMAFLVAGAFASTAVAATVGTTALLVANEVSADSYRSTWFLWWFGDAIGALIVAPLLLAWLAPPWRVLRRQHLIEGVGLLAALIGVSLLVFSADRWQYPYVIFPFLVWAAVRFDLRGAATANFVVTAIAVWATVDGSVLIEGATPTETVQILQALIAVVSVSMLLVAATVAERAEAQADLAGSLSLLEATLDATADGVLVVDLDGRIVRFNQRFVDMWGIPSELAEAGSDEAAQRFVLDQLADPPSFLARVRELYARPHEESTDMLLLKEGRVVERYSRPQRIGARIVGRVWSFRDVTAARQAEVLRGRFLDMAGHEMRNPLSVITGLAGILADDRDTLDQATQRDYLDRIRGRARELDELIGTLLLASRAEAGRLEPDIATLELVEHVRAIASGHDDVKVVGADVLARGDPEYVRNMTTNYLTNAEKYGLPPITIEVVAVGDAAEVAVVDSGRGVPSELASDLFERFSPARAALNPRAPGTGLGLWIVRELARAQGGDVWYDRHPASTRFCFRLPLA
jgi:integral membrane sensor domain MASE1/nitrogen-specific signal transduction histidine kinase